MGEESINPPAGTAEARFAQGFNCAQAVFSFFAARYGLDETAALKMASLFGGGVSRRGELCGAVSGALLALGLARGASTPEGKEEAYRLGQEFMRQFDARHHSLLCRDLLGYDISQPGIREQARQAGVFKTRCPVFVRDAAEIVQTMLETTGA
jgi:C_GCAxxG_C_C family probable redox protein